MTWPTVAVNTTNVDQTTDSPATARADLLDLIQKCNLMIAQVSSFMGGHLADTTAAAARTTLGAAASGTLASSGITGAAPLASPTFTGTVTAPAFAGPLTGNVTGNVSGTAGSAPAAGGTSAACSGNAATATTDSQHFGVGQTWQNMTVSRAASTTYTNSTGKPIWVKINVTNGAGQLTPTVGGVALPATPLATNVNVDPWVDFIVPSGATYSCASATALTAWYECR